MPLLSRLKQLPHLFNHRLYVCLFLSEDCASGFLFNSFCLVTCYFPECSAAQLIRGCFAFQQPPRAGIFSPSPLPFPPPPLSSNRHGGLDKRSGASYRLLALIRRLHCRLMFVICYICHINLTQVKKGILRPYLLLPTSESIFLT